MRVEAMGSRSWYAGEKTVNFISKCGTMKSTFRFLLSLSFAALFFASAENASSQSKGRLPDKGTQSVEGCLACPGSEWSNTIAITKKDQQCAGTELSANGFCFQTNCFYSRGLIGSDFGFNLPETATVNGIIVKVSRKTDVSQSVKDSFIQLQKGITPVGAKKKAKGYWDVEANIKTYGSASDLWGASWSAAEINSSDFSVWMKAYNASANATQASVDFMRVTVYYSEGLLKKSQTAEFQLSDDALGIFPNPVGDKAIVTCKALHDGNMHLALYDVTGVLILEMNEYVSAGLFNKEIDIQRLPPGNYFLRCQLNGKTGNARFVKQ